MTDPTNSAKTIKEPLGGAPYFATLVQQLKAQNPLNIVVGAGDMVGASPLDSALFHDEPTIQALSQIGLEFTSVGNHEFDQGQTELQRKQNGGCYKGGTVGGDTCLVNGSFAGASWKYLAANVIDNTTGKTLFPPYAIKQFDIGGGKKVGIAFIGLVLKETPTLVTASGVANLTFTDEAAAANALIPEIQKQGINAIVVLIHQGLFTNVGFDDKSCAGANGDLLPILDKLDPSIPLVISGHTHWSYICPQGQGATTSKVFYTSAGKYGSYITALDLTLDTASGKVTGIAADNKLVVNDSATNPAPTAYPTLAPDATIAALVKQYDTASATLVNKVVGTVTADFTTTGESVSSGKTGESPLGDIIADSQLAASQADPSPAVIAFMNPGGIRNSLFFNPTSAGIPASVGIQNGQITYGEAYNVQPFGDILTDLDLTGDQIYTLLGQQWVGQTSPKILEVSKGFTYTWDNSKADGTSKVVDGSVKLNGVAIDKTKTYRVEANNFVAGGGDGFTIMTQGKNLYTGPVDVDAFVAYIKANSPLTPAAPNRVTRLN
ncbi:MAG: bifunctional metallophosphatase/5'-nucleotidase [Nevskiales bacterium]